MNNQIIIPSHIQIETVHGICNARCTMCAIMKLSKKSGIMNNQNFITILSKFRPYQEDIRFVSLIGMGEPLTDEGLVDKIGIAKRMGFKGIGISSNCSLLNEIISIKLTKAGLDTLICSVDSLKKEVHESIRIGTCFDDVVSNVKTFIQIRNKLNMNTKIIVRFLSQDKNKHEWDEYCNYWSQFINKLHGDEVVRIFAHNWGNKFNAHNSSFGEGYICNYVFDRMVIMYNGDVAMCCVDTDGINNTGNVLLNDPIKIYNNEIFNEYRKEMQTGNILRLKLCKDCAIPSMRIK